MTITSQLFPYSKAFDSDNFPPSWRESCNAEFRSVIKLTRYLDDGGHKVDLYRYINNQKHTSLIDQPLRRNLVDLAGDRMEISRHFTETYSALHLTKEELFRIVEDNLRPHR
jgi:hypothetical protein